MSKYPGTFGFLEALEKIPKRPVNKTDPKPIIVDPPKKEFSYLTLERNRVLCARCETIIQERYFSHHIASGACQRIQEKAR